MEQQLMTTIGMILPTTWMTITGMMALAPTATAGLTLVILFTPHTPPQIMDTGLITMMMDAISPQIPMQMPMIGNTEPTILGTPQEWEMVLAGAIPVTQSIHTQLLQQSIMDMDLSMMMTVAILAKIQMQMPTTGNMEPTIPGIPLMALITHGTTPMDLVTDLEAMTGLTPVILLTPLT